LQLGKINIDELHGQKRQNIREKHDQSRVDRFCRAIKDLTIPISEAEALKPKGGIMCAHEDWCDTMKTGIGTDCNQPLAAARNNLHCGPELRR